MVGGAARPGRRAVLGLAAGLLAASAARGQADRPRPAPRLAAVDWAMLETAVAIGHMPVAACELIRFRIDAARPEIPPGVIDLGLRGAPNYELLQLARPDLILSSPFYVQHRARLETIAPVLSVDVYTPGEPPLPKALAALDRLGEAVDDRPAARQARARAEARLDALAARLERHADRPFSLIGIGDARHLRSFGHDSLFGSVLTRLGLENAWTDRTQFSFRAPLPIERLADTPEARLVILGGIPVEARQGLSRSILWRALPPVAAGRVYHLPEVNAFGGVPAALRFAGLLADALDAGPGAWPGAEPEAA